MRFLLIVSLLLALPLSAATLQVEVSRNGFTGPLEIALAPRVEDQPPEWSATKTLAADQSSVRFTELAPGLYIVLARGPQPLQRLGLKANVGTGTQTVQLTLPQSVTALQVTLAGEPISRASVLLTEEELRWETELTTDDEGRFRGALWEAGRYDARVRREPTTAPHVAHVHLGTNPVTIDVPDRHIRGKIVGPDGKPIAGAMVALRTENSESALNVRTQSAPDGRFDFFGVREGTHSLFARATSYLQSDLTAFEMRGATAHRTVDLTLSRGEPRAVRVENARGLPLAKATLFGACDGHVKSTSVTNEQGVGSIALPRSGSCAVYVAPREGSIGVARVEGDGKVVVRVPSGSSSLKLALQSESGNAFADFWLLMRIDGVVVPPSVGRQLLSRGLPLLTDADGKVVLEHIPPGTYEFWPYRNEAEGQLLYEMSSSYAAPITVNVTSGENTATVKFKAR